MTRTEQRLHAWWQSTTTRFEYPVLTEMSVRGDPGLRGMRDLSLSFEYPLTVLCGRNGTGKSTILALAALAFHSPPGHQPLNAMRPPDGKTRTTYYTFRDFFFRGPGDPDTSGVEITWRYRGSPAPNPISIQKRSDKWMRYERRPLRPVHHVGIARVLPAIERRVLRGHFSGTGPVLSSTSLSAASRERLGRLMGRTYMEAGVMESEKYSLRQASFRGTYSSFNMGAGEDLLIELLHLIDTAPNGSLIVVEEVEGGLHPEAARNLALELQQLAWEKKLQLIVSTHSEHFIDAVPRQARVLLERWDDVHNVTPRPTTRLAAGEMSGRARPEMLILCEDHAASLVIEQALPAVSRRRVKVVPVGSDSELADQAAFHFLVRGGEHCLIVWDGDVIEGDLRRWLRAASRRAPAVAERANWVRLPGGVAPEAFILGMLDGEDAIGCLADDLREDPGRIAALLTTIGGEDHHKIPSQFGEQFQLDAEQALRLMLRAASKNPLCDFSAIVNTVESILDGNIVQDPALDSVAVLEQAG